MSVSKFATLRQDTLNRFYTRVAVGSLLAEALGRRAAPKKILDLGAGDGSLTAAISQRWNKPEFVTVDIDRSSGPALHANLAALGVKNHQHYVHDALDSKLPELLDGHGAFDLAVCNPPFFRPAWQRDFARILQDANMQDACPSVSDAGAELLFLSQNLRVVRSGGVVALIVPDGLVTGWRSIPLRETLMRLHSIDCVMQLPAHACHGTEARCFIVFITKDAKQAARVKLLRYDNKVGKSTPLYIDAEAGYQRLDYDFHSTKSDKRVGLTTLRMLGAEIRRGSLSTTEARKAGFATFHTTNFDSASKAGRVTLATSKLAAHGKLVIAQKGDILMARVDRSLHTKIVLVTGGQAALTDCVYRVRLPYGNKATVLKALRSKSGTASILAVSKGVSARLLGKADLLDISLRIGRS